MRYRKEGRDASLYIKGSNQADRVFVADIYLDEFGQIRIEHTVDIFVD